MKCRKKHFFHGIQVNAIGLEGENYKIRLTLETTSSFMEQGKDETRRKELTEIRGEAETDNK